MVNFGCGAQLHPCRKTINEKKKKNHEPVYVCKCTAEERQAKKFLKNGTCRTYTHSRLGNKKKFHLIIKQQ